MGDSDARRAAEIALRSWDQYKALRALLAEPPLAPPPAPCGGRCEDALDSRSPCQSCAERLAPPPAPEATVLPVCLDCGFASGGHVHVVRDEGEEAVRYPTPEEWNAALRLASRPAPSPARDEVREALLHCEGIFLRYEVNRPDAEQITDGALALIRRALSAISSDSTRREASGCVCSDKARGYCHVHDTFLPTLPPSPARDEVREAAEALRGALETERNCKIGCIHLAEVIRTGDMVLAALSRGVKEGEAMSGARKAALVEALKKARGYVAATHGQLAAACYPNVVTPVLEEIDRALALYGGAG